MKKIILLILLLSSCSRGVYRSQSSSQEMLRPPYLHVGDTIGIVSISSRVQPGPFDSARFELIRSWGLHIKFGQHLYDHSGWFSGTDTDRAADLQQMMDDKNVKAILFNNGGYGAVRTLDYLDLRALTRNPKWLAGYSDVTMIHYAAQKAGVESLHSTMPVSFVKDSTAYDESAASLRDALFGLTTSYRIAPHPLNQKGSAKGRLTGGNLSLIYAANGTDVDNNLAEPSVLLIEDISESIYHLDRMLQNLKRTGKLSRVKAILVGHFTNTKDEPRFGKSIYELISEYTSDLRIPVIYGFPVGHEAPNYALYMGRMVKISVDKDGGVVEFI